MVALSKHFKGSNLAQKDFELRAWIKKCHFGNFSERAEMALLCYCGTQKRIIAFEKIIFVLGVEDYLERLEGKIRKSLINYVKIF